MTPKIYEQLAEILKHEPLQFDKFYALARDAGSRWSEIQVKLFLNCIEGVEIELKSDKTEMVSIGKRSPEEELASAIIEVVRSQAGMPIPANEIKRRLPASFVTTEEQIKAIAKRSPILEIFGLGLIQMRKY